MLSYQRRTLLSHGNYRAVEGSWMHHLFICLFICWSHRMVAPFALLPFYCSMHLKRWYQCQYCLWSLEVLFSSLLYRWAFIGFSCCFGGFFYSLHFTLLSLLHHAFSERFGGSWLWAWAHSPMAFDILLGLFGSPLL